VAQLAALALLAKEETAATEEMAAKGDEQGAMGEKVVQLGTDGRPTC
jgi:hypothetical protein